MGFQDTGQKTQSHTLIFSYLPTSFQLFSRITRFFSFFYEPLQHHPDHEWPRFYNWHWINLPRKTTLQRVQCAVTEKIMGVEMHMWTASQFWICPSCLEWKEAHIILHRCFCQEFNTCIYKFYSWILERQFPLEREKDSYTHTHTNKVPNSVLLKYYYCFQNSTTTFIHYWMHNQIVFIINLSHSLGLLLRWDEP